MPLKPLSIVPTKLLKGLYNFLAAMLEGIPA